MHHFGTPGIPRPPVGFGVTGLPGSSRTSAGFTRTFTPDRAIIKQSVRVAAHATQSSHTTPTAPPTLAPPPSKKALLSIPVSCSSGHSGGHDQASGYYQPHDYDRSGPSPGSGQNHCDVCGVQTGDPISFQHLDGEKHKKALNNLCLDKIGQQNTVSDGFSKQNMTKYEGKLVWWCMACMRITNSLSDLENHLKSASHFKKFKARGGLDYFIPHDKDDILRQMACEEHIEKQEKACQIASSSDPKVTTSSAPLAILETQELLPMISIINNKYFCNPCATTLQSKDTFNKHLGGTKHKKRIESLGEDKFRPYEFPGPLWSGKKPKPPAGVLVRPEETRKVTVQPKTSPSLSSLSYGEDGLDPNSPVAPGTPLAEVRKAFWCNPCGLPFATEKKLELHFTLKQHDDHMKKFGDNADNFVNPTENQHPGSLPLPSAALPPPLL